MGSPLSRIGAFLILACPTGAVASCFLPAEFNAITYDGQTSSPKGPTFAQVEEQVLSIIAEHLGLKRQQVSPASQIEELGADSLDRIEFRMAIEEEYRREISDDEVTGWRTVADIVRSAKRGH